MPEICPKSANNPHHQPPSKSRRQSREPVEADTGQDGCLIRRYLFDQLTTIQINTAGLSGPYRSEKETMEQVCGNHQAVKELRRLLRHSLLVPQKGQLWDLLLTAALAACDGDMSKAAHLLGTPLKRLRSWTAESTAAKVP